MIPKH